MAFFTSVILGIRPLQPGWEVIEVQPFTADLQHARGECLRPQGLITVEWEIRDETFVLSVRAPASIQGKIIMPDGTTHPLKSDIPLSIIYS